MSSPSETKGFLPGWDHQVQHCKVLPLRVLALREKICLMVSPILEVWVFSINLVTCQDLGGVVLCENSVC